VGRKGLQRKSFLPPGGKKIEAESLVFGAPAPKMRAYFLNLLTVDRHRQKPEISIKKPVFFREVRGLVSLASFRVRRANK
jgi:hypothetical protein